MLRNVLIGFGVLCIACGAAVFFTGAWPGGFAPMIFGALLLLGTLGEQLIYKPVERGRPGPGWVATEERFLDDATGKPIRVWVEPKSGERAYVND